MRTPVALPPFKEKRKMTGQVHRSYTVYSFDLENETEAIKLAKKLSEKTGRRVVVRGADGLEIATIVPLGPQ